MTTYAERVAAAPDMKAALCAIAEGLDAILSSQTPQPADAWSWSESVTVPAAGPGAQPAVGTLHAVEVKARAAEEEINAVRQALVTATGDDRLQLEARLRLLEDDGASVELSLPEGTRPTTVEADGSVIVDLPPASPEQRIAREAFAFSHGLWQFQSPPVTLDQDEFIRAYAVGGPAWFYYGDREGAISLPIDVRRAMVEEIERQSPALASEIARDLLMYRGPQDQSNARAMNDLVEQ